MKFDEVKASLEKATKIEEVKEAIASAINFADEVAKASEKLVAERDAEKAKAEASAKAELDAKAAVETLKGELETLKTNLSTLQSAQAAQAAELKFNERMAAVDSEFEFTDEERALVVDEVKDLNDEAFAKWMNKSKILMAAKCKSAKKEAKSTKKDPDGDGDDDSDPSKDTDKDGGDPKKAKAKKSAKASDDSDEDDSSKKTAKASVEIVTEAAASITDSQIPNSSEAGESLASQLAAAFKSGLTIGGKKVE